MVELVRSFIAVDADERLLESFRRIQADLEATGADLKTVAPENLHLTLKFLGEIPQPRVEAVIRELSKLKFKPFKIKKPEKPRRFQAIPDPPNKFSTGAPDLDAVLNGGYPKGATVLLEVDRQIETLQYHLLITPTAWNFVVKGRVIVVIPSVGIDYNVVIRRGLDAGLTMEEINKYLRVTLFETLKGPTEPYIIKVKGDNMSEDLTKVFSEVESLGKKLGKPALAVIGADTLLSRYGEDNALKAISTGSTVTRERGALNIILLKPGYTRVAEILRAASDVHLRVTREHGVILFYGVKPRTGLYVMEMDVSQGYPLPKLTPIV